MINELTGESYICLMGVSGNSLVRLVHGSKLGLSGAVPLCIA
jgi:hypothetical protein